MEEKLPKVLVGAPTWKGHDYIIDRYIENLKKFTYPNFDVCFVDTSKEEWQELKNKEFGDILRCEPENFIFSTLAKTRNILINKMLSGGYDYFLMLDTDTLPPADTIERLMSHKKDMVGFVSSGCGRVDVKPIPIVLKDGNMVRHGKHGLNWYSWEEIEALEGNLTKVWATSVGCLLVKRNVFEAGVRFRHSPSMSIGEDIWFFVEANSAGFEFWIDPYQVIHENRPWKKSYPEEFIQEFNRIQKSNLSKAEMNVRIKRLELMLINLIAQLKLAKVIE